MNGISLSYYAHLFDKELSIAQAKLDVTSNFWIDEVKPHLMLCYSLILVLDTFPKDKNNSIRAFHRYMDLKVMYEQKRQLWATIDNSKDSFDDLPF